MGKNNKKKKVVLENEQDYSSKQLILSPEYEKLKNEVEKMRIELSMLYLERDELLFVICVNIETAYLLEFGSLEYNVYKAECAVLRLKRKIDLFQAKINRQEKIVLSEIENLLDEEFKEYQEKLNEQMEKINDALRRSKAKFLTDEENEELKKLYRKIVKVLHPDINPNITKEEFKLLQNAIEAYKNGDLKALRIISELIDKDLMLNQDRDLSYTLIKDKERLEAFIKEMKEIIAEIKTNYPYNVKEIIENPSKLNQRKQELKETLEYYNELISIYKDRIEKMLRS